MPFPFAKYFNNLWLKTFSRSGYFYLLLLFYRHLPCQGNSSSIKYSAGIAVYALTPTNYLSMQQPGKGRNQAEKKQGREGLFSTNLTAVHNSVFTSFTSVLPHRFYCVTKNINKHKWTRADRKKISLWWQPRAQFLPRWTIYLHFPLHGLIFPPAQHRYPQVISLLLIFPYFLYEIMVN